MKHKIYSYKVCYNEKDSNEIKIHLVTNRYENAKWDVEYFTIHPPNDRKDKHKLRDVNWYIIPITNKFENEKLWKGCPFKMDAHFKT